MAGVIQRGDIGRNIHAGDRCSRRLIVAVLLSDWFFKQAISNKNSAKGVTECRQSSSLARFDGPNKSE
jgi:hypothetical protein